MSHKVFGILGIILTLLGLILSFNIFTHYTIIFLIGWFFLMLYLNEKFYNNSKLRTHLSILRNKKFLIGLIILGVVVTLIIEYIGAYISPAWIYSFDFLNFKLDFWFSIGAYIMYVPATYETFLLLSNIFKLKNKKALIDKNIIISLLIISLFLLTIPFIWKSSNYPGLPFCFFLLGVFLLTDFLNYKISKKSVIIRSMKTPRYFLIILLTSLIMSILSEYTNVFQFVWTYINLPFIDLTLFKVPIIILIGWIPLVALWINLFEIIESYLRQKKLLN